MNETSPPPSGTSHREALQALATARHHAAAGTPLAIEVVDGFGHRIAYQRMDDTMLVAAHTVPAATAARLGARTTPFVVWAESDPPTALSTSKVAGLVVSAGAIPLRRCGRVVGAVGASGGRAVEDANASEAAARTLGIAEEGLPCPPG